MKPCVLKCCTPVEDITFLYEKTLHSSYTYKSATPVESIASGPPSPNSMLMALQKGFFMQIHQSTCKVLGTC